MKKLSIFLLVLVLVGAGCGNEVEPVVEAEVVSSKPYIVTEALMDGDYLIDSSVSKVAWAASKVIGSGHNVEIVMSDGELVVLECKFFASLGDNVVMDDVDLMLNVT